VLRSDGDGGSVAGESRLLMIQNTDGTITVPSEEVVAAAGLNEQLTRLGIRAKAVRADPGCSSTVAEVRWGDLYPRIVIQNRPALGITIQPNAIPVDHTLVLAAERSARPRRQPPIVVRTLLVSGRAPACVGEFLRLPSPLARLTTSAREVVAQARQDAFELQHPNVGPEHILLALLRRRGDVAAQALSAQHVTLEHIRPQVAESGQPARPRALRSSALAAPFTPRATGALDRARIEASELGNESVEPEHILLGLASDPESAVARMLRQTGADPEQIRTAVLLLLNRAPPDGDPPNH
jgi:hypothetical protein